MKMFANMMKRGMKTKLSDTAMCLDSNYSKGCLNKQGRAGVYEEVCITECGGGMSEISRPIKARYGALGRNEYVPKREGESSGVVEMENMPKGKYRIRKLTPKECFRLQGWEDEYFERARFVNSDSQLYKQAGNGVTVTVIEAIARRFE